jgi:hypothetical protein
LENQRLALGWLRGDPAPELPNRVDQIDVGPTREIGW